MRSKLSRNKKGQLDREDREICSLSMRDLGEEQYDSAILNSAGTACKDAIFTNGTRGTAAFGLGTLDSDAHQATVRCSSKHPAFISGDSRPAARPKPTKAPKQGTRRPISYLSGSALWSSRFAFPQPFVSIGSGLNHVGGRQNLGPPGSFPAE